MLPSPEGRAAHPTGATTAGVDDDGSGFTDFANAELTDDAGDVAAAAIARDLVRGSAIPAGGKEAGEEEETPLATPAGCRNASRRAAATSRPLGALPPLVR